MNNKKSNVFISLFIVIILIGIIIYLIANVKQPYVECSLSNTDDLGITINEKVITTLSSRSITSLNITKKIILPKKYDTSSNKNAIIYSLNSAFEYLGDDVTIREEDNTIIVNIKTDSKIPVILDNISFNYTDSLAININTNTKSSDVFTISVGDKYSEGELMVSLKNYGYNCK